QKGFVPEQLASRSAQRWPVCLLARIKRATVGFWDDGNDNCHQYAGQAHQQACCPPPVRSRYHAAEKYAQARTHGRRNIEERHGSAALPCRIAIGNEAGSYGHVRGFPHSDDRPCQGQLNESMRQPGYPRRQTPDTNRGGDKLRTLCAIPDPAYDRREKRIRQQKRQTNDAELGIIQAQVLSNGLEQSADYEAVNIVEKIDGK